MENETGRSETIINEAELAAREDIVFDPQTSGGLLIAVESQQTEALFEELKQAGHPAAIVGEIIPKAEKEIYVGVL